MKAINVIRMALLVLLMAISTLAIIGDDVVMHLIGIVVIIMCIGKMCDIWEDWNKYNN